MNAFPWTEVMRFGFGVMRLSSREFWALTPRELAAAVGAMGAQRVPPGRGRLEQMMREFPDEVRHG